MSQNINALVVTEDPALLEIEFHGELVIDLTLLGHGWFTEPLST